MGLLVSTHFGTAPYRIDAKNFLDYRGRVRQMFKKIWLRFEEVGNFV